MKAWLAAVAALAAMALSSAAQAVAPQGCYGTVDKPTMPAQGGTITISLFCPNPAPNGIDARLVGPNGAGQIDAYSNAGATISGDTFPITVNANPGPGARTDSWYWHTCDYARVNCVDTASFSTTVAAPTAAVPSCTLSASNTSPTIGQTITISASCSNGPTSYTWTGCSSTTSTCTDSVATPQQKTYTLVAGNAGGQGAPATVTVNWRPPAGSAPSCSVAASSTTPTVGQTVTLTASCTNGPSSYAWTNCSSSGSTCLATSPTAGAQIYSVVATNGAGSSASVGVTVTWQTAGGGGGGGGVPSCSLSASNGSPMIGTTITLTANCTNGPSSYTWTGCAGSGGTCTASSAVAGPVTYGVFASNAAGAGTVVQTTVVWRVAAPPNPVQQTEPRAATTGGPGSGFNALIRGDGSLWSWGDNSLMTLGDGTVNSRSVPAKVAGLANIVAATVGTSYHTLALDSSGHVFAWGLNAYGELGTGNKVQQTRPTAVAGIDGVAQVAAGNFFSVALRTDGTVWTWGRNSVGQLGDGSLVDRLVPGVVPGLANIVSIAASASRAAAVDATGNVYVWGDNLYVPQAQSSRPVAAPISGAVSVAAGGDSTFVRKGDGTLWAWGRPDGGRLGDGGAGNGQTPVQVKNLANVVQVIAGSSTSLALLADGTLWGWGANERGQLARGDTNAVSTPVKLTLPAGVGGLANAAAGDSNFIVDTLGRMFGAGANELGALGQGDLLETRTPEVVADVAGATAVAASATQSLALLADGSVVTWGAGNPADLLSGNAKPHPVPGLAGRFVGIAGGTRNAVAVRDDGAVFGWGSAVPGASAAVTSAVQVPGLAGAKAAATGDTGVIALTTSGRALIACVAGTACPGTDFNVGDAQAVGAGTRHFLVLRGDGSVWAWGANDKGQLGNGTTAAAAAPVQVKGLPAVRAIAAGADYSVAIAGDGTAYAWGLPPPYDAVKPVPVRVPELDGSRVVTAGPHVLALDSAGRGRAWGTGAKVGERDHLAPAREPRMDGLAGLAAGTNHSLGLTANGGVVAWGQNAFQQLGVARQQSATTWVPVIDPANAVFTQNAVPVAEFVNPSIALGHFFITANPEEAAALDAGNPVRGWQRTGRAWRAWLATDAPPGAKPVYRFFSSRWNSHFYTADEAEKNALLAKNPTQDPAVDWKLESIAFYAMTPASGCPALTVQPSSPYLCTGGQVPAARDCAAGFYPVYRAYDIGPKSGRTDPNHRITSNWIDVYRGVRFFGYVYEGVGFCAPASAQRGGDLHAFHTHPGDSVTAGDFLQNDYWYANAGPGESNGATLVAVMPDDWTVSQCQAYHGAQCPPQAQLTPKSLREGVVVPALPAGGVLRLTAFGQAPAQAQTLTFTSSIGAPSLAPDPYGYNNAAPVSQTVVKPAAACAAVATPAAVALTPDGTGPAPRLAIAAAADCEWQAAGDGFVTVTPGSGKGPATVAVAAGSNESGAERQGTITLTSGGQSALVPVRQAPRAIGGPCASLRLSRKADQQGSTQTAASVVAVQAPTTSCTWDVRSDRDWVVLIAASRSGTGQVEYAVLANPDPVPRSATLTIGTETFTVFQEAAATHSDADNGGAGDGGGDGSGSGGDAGG